MHLTGVRYTKQVNKYWYSWMTLEYHKHVKEYYYIEGAKFNSKCKAIKFIFGFQYNIHSQYNKI